MKKLFLLLVFFSFFAFAQMPNIERVWLNEGRAYKGNIGNNKEVLKLKINVSEQDRKNDQEYFVSGETVVDVNVSKFEGKLKITKYKDGKKISKVYGEYDFSEEPNGKHSGNLKGTFIYTFRWDKDGEQILDPRIEFSGDWKSYDGSLSYKTELRND